jgi:hypothetical protein
VGLHVGAQDGVDAGLVFALVPEPAEPICVEPHHHDFVRCGQHDFCGFPDIGVHGASRAYNNSMRSAINENGHLEHEAE